MLEKLQEIFNDVTGNTDVTLTKRTKIDDSIGVSSFTRIQLICAMEDEFSIEIPNVQIAKFKTVGDILKYLQERGIDA